MTTRIEAESKSEKLSDDDSKRHEFIVSLAAKVRQDDQDRAVWEHKQITASNQRLGVRRRTNSPYPGYAEVPVPTTDKIIKQKKSIFSSVATVPKKQIVVSVDGEQGKQDTRQRASANKVEKALNGLVRKKDFRWTKNINLFIDYFLENGHALFKVIEKFFSKIAIITIDLDEDFTEEEEKGLRKRKNSELEVILAERLQMDLEDKGDKKAIKDAIKKFRAGKRVIKIERRDFFTEPTVIPVRATNIIVPHGTTDVQSATRITHDMWVNYEFLRSRADKGIYDSKVIDTLTPDSGTVDDSLINTNWALTEGLTNTQSGSGGGELFNVRESVTWYENEDTSKLEKWVFSWIESKGADQRDRSSNRLNTSAQEDMKIIQEAKLPPEHGLWPYVKHDNEYKNTRWYASRGVPEQIRGMHIITEKMFNARVIRDTYNNAPMFRVSKQLGWSGDELRVRPGQFLEAEQGQIEQINKAITTDISSERIEQQAKAYIEEYQAIPDLARTSSVNTGEKTATEVQTIRAALSQQTSTDIALFLESLSEVAWQMYLILKQSITKPTVIGGVLLTPEDFLPKYNVSWVGSIDATNSGFLSQKVLEKINVLQATGVPMGLVTRQDMYNALRLWLVQDPDVEDPDLLITEPQEILTDEAENQMGEIVLMINGMNPRVKPDDQHETHLQVIEEWMNTPEGKQHMKRPEVAERIQTHANVHIQAEQLQNPGGNGNGNTSARRRQVASTTGS